MIVNFMKKKKPSNPPPEFDEKLVRHLKKQSLFANTPDDVLAQLATQIEIRSLEQGDVLLQQNAPSESLFIIRKGWFKVTTNNYDGEEVMLDQYGPGQLIGELSLLDRMPRENSVIALRPAEVIEIKYDVVLGLLDQHPALARSLMQEMSSRVRFANAYTEEAIDWCRHIATGDYAFVQNQVKQTQSTIIGATQSYQARAGAFLSVFFKMIDQVREREENLKKQVHELKIQIDEVQRQKSVKDLTETEFFEDLQATARKLRQEREDKRKDKSINNE